MNLNELAQTLHALERVDASPFQRRARVLQSIWREERGYPCGEHRQDGQRPRLLGSRLPMPWARQSLANFLTPRIREIVRAEVCDPVRSRGKLYGSPRIYCDLLSSQPLCFNLFGELVYDLELSSFLVSEMTRGRFTEVEEIQFEYSPGRRDPRYTGDRSAFDVFISCRTARDGLGFIAVEVKYHENLRGKPSEHRLRYDEIAERMDCFKNLLALREQPLQQIWRDHLLAGITRTVDRYDDALFVLLHPRDNDHCVQAVRAYRDCLSRDCSFESWTFEDITRTLALGSRAEWINLFGDRYLSFDKIDSRLEAVST